MVRRKTTTSSVAVFRDDPDVALPLSSDNNNNDDDDDDNDSDDVSHHLSPPRKKTRLSKESPVAAPKTRRAALKEKATNPSSSDNSFLRPIDKHGSFHEKLQKGKRKNLPDSGTIKAPDLEIKSASPLQEASNITGPVYQALKKQLSAKELDELLSLIARGAAQDTADHIAKKGCWSPGLLNCFRESGLTSLDLSSPASPSGTFIPHEPPGLTVEILFQQHKFSKLTKISFRNTPLLNDDVAFLRLVPSLEDIDLSNTGVGTQSLHHLVCHRHTLKKLNLSLNSLVDDDSRIALSAFPNLIALYLRGTSFTMPGLRRLVSSDLSQSCRLLSVPTHCLDHLNTCQGRYIDDIPTGYVQDPSQVAMLTMPSLKRNLELHAKANRDVQVTGTKVELISRLTIILSNRIADRKIINVLGR